MKFATAAFFAIGASANPWSNSNADSNGSGCTRAGLDALIRANMPAGSNFDDYVIRHKISKKNPKVDFGTAMCKAAPWQGSNNPYKHVHDKKLEEEFVDWVNDNVARDAWLSANGGTEQFPAGSGGFFYCSGSSGNWVQTKDLPACPNHDEQGAWEDTLNTPEVGSTATMDNARFESGVPYASGFKAMNAIDGKIPAYYDQAISRETAHPKLFIDLSTPCKVSQVVVYPRRDCCTDRYMNQKVFLNDDNSLECTHDTPLTNNYVISKQDDGIVYTCNHNVVATEIKVTNEGTWIQVQEVVTFC